METENNDIEPIYVYRAQVEQVYDGDTFKAQVSLGFGVSRFETFRMYGINAPEIRGATKAKATQSRDRLRELILNKDVVIVSYRDRQEKFGRYLADVYVGGVMVNALMVKENLATAYTV